MAEPRRLERLSGQDLLMLWADDFGWSEDIGVLGVLDGTRLLDRDGRVRVEEVRRRLAPRLALVPRFRQLLYRPRWGLGRPLWVDAASFDLADHVLVQPLDPPGGQAELQAACARLGRRRLDPSRPLWELWLLPGLPDHRVGLFVRVHHTIADGVAGVAAFAALLDPTPDAPLAAVPAWTPAPIPTAAELLEDNLRRRLRGLGRGLTRLAHPSGNRRGAARVWHELLAERAPRTSLTARSAPTAAWPSSAAAWRWPGRSPTPTRPRSTTWLWPPWPAACAGCWPAAARTPTGWCCG
jgi:diacylglycerol O-acyltransferase / wax synthase